MKKEKKIVKSIYMDLATVQHIEKEAIKQRRNFSFIANDILEKAIKKNQK